MGSCHAATGCISLISTGTSPYPSEFADASESGSDVFFTTRQSLAPEDQDELVDLYDARIGGGFPVKPIVAPCSGEACHGAPEAQGALETPSSITFSGPGNAVQPASTPATVTPKSLTQAQKLAKVLRTCRKKTRKKQRIACEAQAKKRYGTRKSKSKSLSAERAGSLAVGVGDRPVR
jgi:hypothetical protein